MSGGMVTSKLKPSPGVTVTWVLAEPRVLTLIDA